MSYAVIKTGGKQYRVEEGQTLLVERLPDEPGATIDLVPMLLAGDGKHPVLDAKKLAKTPVKAEIVGQRGTRFKPGDGVGIGKDDTIYAKSAGVVEFRTGRRGRVISVSPATSD